MQLLFLNIRLYTVYYTTVDAQLSFVWILLHMFKAVSRKTLSFDTIARLV